MLHPFGSSTSLHPLDTIRRTGTYETLLAGIDNEYQILNAITVVEDSNFLRYLDPG